jgi:predicted DNA-binding protein (MmcQ/YjbR family)
LARFGIAPTPNPGRGFSLCCCLIRRAGRHVVVSRRSSASGCGRDERLAKLTEMSKAAKEPRLARLTKICLALPDAARECRGSHASFRVRKKVFAYFLNDHHGDGIVSVCAKVLPGDNTALISAQPDRFYLPAYIGPRGWVALRLDRGAIDWKEVAELVAGSYQLTAPKRRATKR